MTEEIETQEQTASTGGLSEGLDTETKETETTEITNAPIPDGLDDEIFDAETRTLKEDKVVERLKSLNEQITNAKKQANDMRKKLSKGVEAPEKVEEYAEAYTPEERYEFVMSDTESNEGKHIHGVLDVLDKFAYEHGMSKEANKDLKDLYIKYAEEVKIIDARSEEEKETDKATYIAEQKKILGDNANEIIKANVKFFKEYGIFNEDEKKELLLAMDKSAVWNNIGAKIRKLFGQTTSSDIPTRGGIVSGLADDTTLAREYYNPSTPDSRRMEILQQRIDAGRTGGMPMPE